MSTDADAPPLAPNNTVSVEKFSHRLALGVALSDASSGRAPASLTSICLEALGPYALPLSLDRHGEGRHSLRLAGRVARVLAHALAHGKPTNWSTRIFSQRSAGMGVRGGYSLAADPRSYVPRRVLFQAVLTDGVPALGEDNMHAEWLWPGAAYPFSPTATVLRGRLRRGPDLAHSSVIPWGRVVVTVPDTQLNFALATRVAVGFADDRGEFACALNAGAVSGAALPKTARVRLWPWLPPASTQLDAIDPLASLPLEVAAADARDPLQIELPTGYTQPASQLRTLTLGESNGGSENDLLFA